MSMSPEYINYCLSNLTDAELGAIVRKRMQHAAAEAIKAAAPVVEAQREQHEAEQVAAMVTERVERRALVYPEVEVKACSCLGQCDGDREAIGRTGATPKLINDYHCARLDMAQDECHLAHFCGESGDIGIEIVAGGYTRKKLMNDRERGVLRWYEASDLRHDGH